MQVTTVVGPAKVSATKGLDSLLNFDRVPNFATLTHFKGPKNWEFRWEFSVPKSRLRAEVDSYILAREVQNLIKEG